MGIFVTESLTFTNLGVSHAGCYVTMKATFGHGKAGAPNFGYMGMSMNPATANSSTPYTLSTQFYVYAAKDPALTALQTIPFTLNLAAAPANPIATLYDAFVAANYSTNTITKDL